MGDYWIHSKSKLSNSSIKTHILHRMHDQVFDSTVKGSLIQTDLQFHAQMISRIILHRLHRLCIDACLNAVLLAVNSIQVYFHSLYFSRLPCRLRLLCCRSLFKQALAGLSMGLNGKDSQ